MKRLAFIFLLIALASPAFAIPESNFGPVKDLLENRTGFYSQGSFVGVDNAKIAFTRFGSEAGSKGCLVLSPGQGEASLKYTEVAYDLNQKGYSPIYVIDHRGQGASDHLLPDGQINTVQNFSDYSDDFEAFVDEVVLKDSACRGHTMNLLAHSMGGAIAAIYLERAGSNTPFRRAAMSAPMLKIKYPEGRTENSVITETFFACTLGAGGLMGVPCDGFAPGKGPYDPNNAFLGNPYTHSEARFQFKKDIFSKWPALQVGGPSVRWVRQAALADKDLRRPQNVQRISTPVLILQALNDVIVDNAGQDEFCAAMGRKCQIAKFAGSNHETLMESDSIRDDVISRIDDAFSAK